MLDRFCIVKKRFRRDYTLRASGAIRLTRPAGVNENSAVGLQRRYRISWLTPADLGQAILVIR